jgi:hypothetical protein
MKSQLTYLAKTDPEISSFSIKIWEAKKGHCPDFVGAKKNYLTIYNQLNKRRNSFLRAMLTMLAKFSSFSIFFTKADKPKRPDLDLTGLIVRPLKIDPALASSTDKKLSRNEYDIC